MRYAVVYMPAHMDEDPIESWHDTEDEAWDHIMNMTCGFGTGELCEMCQAEYGVMREDEL